MAGHVNVFVGAKKMMRPVQGPCSKSVTGRSARYWNLRGSWGRKRPAYGFSHTDFSAVNFAKSAYITDVVLNET